MNNHVPTLETCIKMNESGFPQGTWHCWYLNRFNEWIVDLMPNTIADSHQHRFVAAPILSEILEQLPKSQPFSDDEDDERRVLLQMRVGLGLAEAISFGFGYAGGKIAYPYPSDLNPAEAAALLWLSLKEANDQPT